MPALTEFTLNRWSVKAKGPHWSTASQLWISATECKKQIQAAMEEPSKLHLHHVDLVFCHLTYILRCWFPFLQVTRNFLWNSGIKKTRTDRRSEEEGREGRREKKMRKHEEREWWKRGEMAQKKKGQWRRIERERASILYYLLTKASSFTRCSNHEHILSKKQI